jgi:hypothetical protein
MTEEEKNQLRLALAIFSGRTEPSELHDSELSLLGYDIYKFQYYGTPKPHEIRGMCEDIVFEMIVRVIEAGKLTQAPSAHAGAG